MTIEKTIKEIEANKKKGLEKQNEVLEATRKNYNKPSEFVTAKGKNISATGGLVKKREFLNESKDEATGSDNESKDDTSKDSKLEVESETKIDTSENTDKEKVKK